jgi:dephospho-CoA kinase
VLVVDVSESVQIERTCRRDDNTEEQVKAILAAQGSRKQRLATATDVLDNSGDLATLETLAASLHEQFLTLANGASATP